MLETVSHYWLGFARHTWMGTCIHLPSFVSCFDYMVLKITLNIVHNAFMRISWCILVYVIQKVSQLVHDSDIARNLSFTFIFHSILVEIIIDTITIKGIFLSVTLAKFTVLHYWLVAARNSSREPGSTEVSLIHARLFVKSSKACIK